MASAVFCRTLSTLLTGGHAAGRGAWQNGGRIRSAGRLGARLGEERNADGARKASHCHSARWPRGQVMPELALDMIEVGESSGALGANV